MADAEEGEGKAPRGLLDALLATDRGVWWFLLFLLLLVAGFLLVLTGHTVSGTIAGALALLSLLAMAVTTPPHALPPGAPAVAEGEAADASGEGEVTSEVERLSREAAPAPTRAGRRTPEPPPEPPPEATPEDEVIVDLE